LTASSSSAITGPRALRQCQPYGFLPAAKYKEWKVLDLSFSPTGLSARSLAIHLAAHDPPFAQLVGRPLPAVALPAIAQLTARLSAAFVLDSAGVTRTKALGSERMARKLRDSLPGDDSALRAAVWEFMRPMLSPALVALNRDSFVLDERIETTVDLEAHRVSSDLDELALDEEPDAEAT